MAKSPINYRVRFGNPSGVRDTQAQVNAAAIKAVAEAALKRVQKRVKHPSADTLTVTGTNQWSATIAGPRGGPGIIKPVAGRVGRNGRPAALRFTPKQGGVVFAKYVRGKGLGPLIEAETKRVQSSEVNTDDVKIT